MIRRFFEAALLIGASLANTYAGETNLIENPGFEAGQTPWVTWAGATFNAETALPYAGAAAARISNRTQTWQGAVQNIAGKLENGRTYRVSAWVRIDGAAESPVGITLAFEDDNPETFRALVQSTVFDDRWVFIEDFYEHTAQGAELRADFYFQGPPAGVDLLIDEVSLVAMPDWRSEVDERIEQIRKRELIVEARDPNGLPLPGAQVELRQVQRHFPIGTTIDAGALANEPNYASYITERFNWGVHENAAKWYATEPQRDQVSYSSADTVLAWADANGITMRGHTLFWAPERWQPNWVPALDDATLALEVEDRLEDAVAHFRGRFRHWDVNNEMLHGSFYLDRLGAEIRRWMFDRTHEIDPDVALFVNEFDIIAGGGTLTAYLDQIQSFLTDGYPLGGVGVQGHFTSVSPYSLDHRLDQVGNLGLPVWVTEFDVLNADENQRADDLEEFFRVAFSHPDVEGIILWGFWAGNHWRGPDAALVNQDWTLNAAGERLDSLLAEWTSSVSATTDGNGQISARVFHGQYEVTVTPAAGSPRTFLVDVPPGTAPVRLRAGDGIFGDSFEQ